MISKKITIVIPVYNSEMHLCRCLDSLINQTILTDYTDSPYLILMIDDGSSDSSFSIMKTYEKKYPDLFIAVSRSNKGTAETRNEGIDRCNTPYIMFIDNDDYVDSDYVETLLSVIDNGDYDVVISGYRREDKNGNLISRVVLSSDGEWSKYRCVAPWARIFKTDFIKNNKICFFKNNIGEDTVFSLQVYSKTSKIKVEQYCGYVWYVNQDSVSNTVQRGLKKECNIIRMLDELLKYINRDALNEYYIYRYVVWYLLFSGRYASRSVFKETTNELFDWMKCHGINLSTKFYSKLIADEPIKNKLIVAFFDKIVRLHLVGIFASIYCEGK